MKVKAFVLIETTPRQSKDILPKLVSLDGVKSVDPVTGPYDIIATLECEELNDIAELITTKIDRIEGVHRTVTCVAIKTGLYESQGTLVL
jgi:DNA-binding Lrp family transcriptional regulator